MTVARILEGISHGCRAIGRSRLVWPAGGGDIISAAVKSGVKFRRAMIGQMRRRQAVTSRLMAHSASSGNLLSGFATDLDWRRG